jgi:predicted unusual protein kinase regulating ubiquinone biosynthesis (AarF/ABC1/UbiB family)
MNAMPGRIARPASGKRRPGVLKRTPPAPQSRWLAFRALFRWLATWFEFRMKCAWDASRGDPSLEQQARRMRQALEARGGASVLVGRQLSMRIDLMPMEYSIELAQMRDNVPPMPWKEVERRIMDAIGGPLDTAFAELHPLPRTSLMAFCTYWGTLHDGRRVVVKVRREGVRTQVIADLTALAWITRILEMLTWVRSETYQHLRGELLELAKQELEFINQARFQKLFRRRAKKDGLRYASSTRVVAEISNHAVLVTEWVEGVRCSEIIQMVESGDESGLMRLAAMDIDPDVVAERLLQIGWWATLENLFFLSAPSTESVIVQPGNQIVFTNFEECGTLSATHKRLYRLALSRMCQDDVSGAGQALLQLLCPLPFIDTHDFSKRIEAGLWQALFGLRDDEAEWWERATLGIWRTVLQCAREDGFAVRLEIVRMMRSALTFDLMAARLRPDLSLLREFERYQRRADRRAATAAVRDIAKLDAQQLRSATIARVARTAEGLSRLGLWIETTVENLPIANLALSGKAATVISELLRYLFRCGGIYALTVGGLLLFRLSRGMSIDPFALLWDGVRLPALWILLAMFGIFSLRRVLYRLEDKTTGT